MLKSGGSLLCTQCYVSIFQLLRCLQLQLVDGQTLALQTASTDREKLFEALDVILDFRNGFR